MSNHQKKTYFNLLNDDNKFISDQKIIANKFNNYFANVGSNIDKQIPKTIGDFRNYLYNIKCSKSFFLYATGPLEIDKIIETLNINKSTGTNSIHVYILKILKSFFPIGCLKLSTRLLRYLFFQTYLKLQKVYLFIRKVAN